MADLEFQDAYLGSAARLLADASSQIRSNRAMPMLHVDSYTGIGETVASFMSAAGMASEALSDAAAEGAVSVAAVMSVSALIDHELSQSLGPGFTK